MQCAAGEIRGKEPGDAGLALKAENFTNGCAAFGFGSFSQGLSSCCPCLFAPIALFSANLRYISIKSPFLTDVQELSQRDHLRGSPFGFLCADRHSGTLQ